MELDLHESGKEGSCNAAMGVVRLFQPWAGVELGLVAGWQMGFFVMVE